MSDVEKTTRQKVSVGGLLDLWDKLELVFEDHGRTGRYRTRLEDITETSLVIDRPSLISGDALFEVGADFTAYFFKPDSAYTFNGTILSKDPDGRDTYLIPYPRNIERNQRRRYYRIEVEGVAVLIPCDSFLTGKCEESDLGEFEGSCRNLSGNGLLVKSRYSGSAGQRFFVRLKPNDFPRELALLAVARRVDTDEEGWHYYGLEIFTLEEQQMLLSQRELQRVPRRYQMFTETQRTALLNFVFAQQVAMKKRGII